MVSHHLERTRHALEQPGAVVPHLGRLAVHHAARRAHDLSAVGLADRLVPEADAENRDRRAVSLDERNADARFGRRLRAGADYDRRRAHCGYVVDADRVVADHSRCFTKFAEILDEVVRERVVVVDDEQHPASYLIGSPFSKSYSVWRRSW